MNPACFKEQDGAGLCNELCSLGPLHEPSVRPILVPAYSHYEPKTISLV